MDLIKTSIGITKTIRNVSRLREIVLIFARHGLDEFISRGVTARIPNFVLPRSKKGLKQELAERTEKDWGKIIGFRIRKSFEELGPAFIKFGQLLSTREDFLDQSFIDEMKLLRDQVAPVPFEQVRKSIETSLGCPIDNVFASIDPEAIGTASIGVAYQGVLKDGSQVVVKVRRPGIAKMIETDFSILTFLAEQAEKISKEVKYLGVSRLLHDFAITLQNELNFNIEALNCEKLRNNLSIHDKDHLFYIPKIYKEYTKEDMLVMEKLKGVPFSSLEKLKPSIEELKPKLEQGLTLFSKTFLQDGFFHADLHGGNFFYLEDKNIGIIDFGLMGSLSSKGRKNFIAIVYALLTHNYENLVYEFLDVAQYDVIPDIDVLIGDVRDALTPFVGLTVQQTNFAQLLQTILFTLKKHRLYLPREWFVVFRALITLDGVGRSMGMDFDIFTMMERDIHTLIKGALSKDELLEEAVWAARDVLSSARSFPRHLKWSLKEWSKRGYAIEILHTGHHASVQFIGTSVMFLASSFLSGILFLSGTLILRNSGLTLFSEIPALTWIFWVLGILIMGRASWILKKSRKTC